MRRKKRQRLGSFDYGIYGDKLEHVDRKDELFVTKR